MTQRIVSDIMNRDEEELIWDAFSRDGKVEVERNGKVATYAGLTYWIDDDFDGDESAEESGMNFLAGYVDADGNLVETHNIPAKVFTGMFAGKFPQGTKIDWNGAEQTHFMEETALSCTEVRKIVIPVLEANGFVE